MGRDMARSGEKGNSEASRKAIKANRLIINCQTSKKETSAITFDKYNKTSMKKKGVSISNEVAANQLQVAIGASLRRMRKCSGVSQNELGKLLDLHQAALSRVESGSQYLLPWQLQQISEFFGVGVDSFLSGRINYWAIAERFQRPLPFPKRYREYPFSKSREFLPLLGFLKDAEGATLAGKYLESLDIDEQLLLSPDQPMGAQLNLDLIQHAVSNGLLTKKNFHRWIDQTRAEEFQGFLHFIYESQTSGIDLLQTRIMSASHYETNFNYTIEDRKSKSLVVSVEPAAHMRSLNYKDGVMGDILCAYKKEYFMQFPRYIGQEPLQLSEKECHFRGAHKCVYTLKAS